ncbi:hypothetical protein [Olsenella profusa]|uniref:Uncharacterized protein n=1 Tax=Olsenella profusa TaxID=138595 RepID=A0ABS2F1J6_9ACTN|nr:hypothetical protein [Olsenella profusa]MBM6774685.1 hypothetical protein [Olsenella profusa]
MGVGERGLQVATVTLRPGVPMGFVTGVPFVAALAVAQAFGGRVSWPHAVTSAEGEPLVLVRARAGYDDEGVFVTCDLEPAGEVDLPSEPAALERVVCDAVDEWAAAVSAGAAAGPLAPVLGDYFDALLGMGEPVEVVRGGRVIGRGELAGVDVWGRATVRLEGGAQELEIAPEQAELRAAR